jgi:hypothetical protein
MDGGHRGKSNPLFKMLMNKGGISGKNSDADFHPARRKLM